ncbi:hypothetical protein GTP41_24725 [Pseudoduganella sp. DS3]|uniref:Uncharacterized protein n=1 Tax=Pseudoduganella guangdongensis TaxID=2692179 RepID=A0A6N9HPH7_9BURK|nr:hypothetical protein [Pseudoduganella guangdongensis]MYN05306.1 hypothetical protein [Pseudoduganella guangdongensis]
MTRRTGVPSRPATRFALVALLATALLMAVAAGLRHRIVHAWPDAALAHACLAYDAATLAERLPAAAPLLAPAASLPRPQPCAAPVSHARPAAPPYLPRGPPVLALP